MTSQKTGAIVKTAVGYEITRKTTKKEAYEIIDALPKRTAIKTASPSTSRSKPAVGLPFGSLFLVCLFAVLFLFVALLNVKVNEVSCEISALNDELLELNSEQNEVNAQLIEKNDLTVIRELAEGEYGMVRCSKLPSRYVSVVSGDKAQVLFAEPVQTVSFSTLLSAFGSTLNEFAEYLK